MSLFERTLATCTAAVLLAVQPTISKAATVTIGNYGGIYGYSEPHYGAPQG